MIFDSLFRNKKEGVVLLVDIGSGSIAGAFVLYSQGRIPELLYNIRIPFISSGQQKTSNAAEDIHVLLDTVLSDLVRLGFSQDYFKHADKKIIGTLVTFSSPWFVSKTKKIHVEQDTEFVIAPKFLNSIMQSEEDSFTKELKKQTDSSVDSYKIIEKSIVHVKINGYVLEQPIGKSTKNLDAFVSISAIPENMVVSVCENIFQKLYIPKEKIFFHSFPLVAFTVLRDIFPVDTNYLFADISGEATEISLVEDGVMMQTVSFPSGRNFIIRQIAKVFDTSLEIAESTLSLYTSKKTDKETTDCIIGILMDIEKEWSIYLENALLELSATMTLPTKLYMTVDTDIAEYYVGFLAEEKTDETGSFRKNLSVVLINEASLSGLYKGKTNLPEDEFIGLLAIFYKKCFSNF